VNSLSRLLWRRIPLPWRNRSLRPCLHLSDFHEEIIGRKSGNKINKGILKNICQIGIITNDKKEGPFTLEIDYIEFYKK
jgi:hypothetical protein